MARKRMSRITQDNAGHLRRGRMTVQQKSAGPIVPADTRITESGDIRVTESGDARWTEGD